MTDARGHLKREQRAFLAAYERVGNLSAAASAAQVWRQRHYEWMEEEDYANAFAEAQETAIDVLETEAVRRAVFGVDEPQVHKGHIQYNDDGTPVTVKKYSDVLLIFLLKGCRPHKYRDNYSVELSGPNGGPIQVQALRDQVNALRSDPEAMRALDTLSEHMKALVAPEDVTEPGGNGDGATGGNGRQ